MLDKHVLWPCHLTQDHPADLPRWTPKPDETPLKIVQHAWVVGNTQRLQCRGHCSLGRGGAWFFRSREISNGNFMPTRLTRGMTAQSGYYHFTAAPPAFALCCFSFLSASLFCSAANAFKSGLLPVRSAEAPIGARQRVDATTAASGGTPFALFISTSAVPSSIGKNDHARDA